MNNIFERNCVAAILLKIQAIYSLRLSLKIDKVALTHLAMEIHLQTTDHVVAVEKVAAQHIGTKYSKCNSVEVIFFFILFLFCLGFYVAFNTVQVISRRVVGRAEETST